MESYRHPEAIKNNEPPPIGSAMAMIRKLTHCGALRRVDRLDLAHGKNAYWLASGNLTQTIFDGDRLRNNLRALGGAEAGAGVRLSADYPAGLSERVGCADWAPEVPGIP
jgi:hypothetical protein